MDPMAEKYYAMTPYGYCAGNPMNLIDIFGTNPIYSKDGKLLGTDNNGIQGYAIIMDKEKFIQGMSYDKAASYDLGMAGLIDETALMSFLGSYLTLNQRPDWDGFITRKEGIRWAKEHPYAKECPSGQNTLYAATSNLDFGNIRISSDISQLGSRVPVNLFNFGNTLKSVINARLRNTVYGLGRIYLIPQDEKGTVRIDNEDESVYYDWNKGGDLIRTIAISLERALNNLDDSHGFKVYYYGEGHLRE